MQVVEIINKKRNGQQLRAIEIEALIQAYLADKVPDYQISALLMAIYFQGMTIEETSALTMAMAHSGKILDLSSIPGIKVDKHSTGGVADTTTLILAPLVAAAGVPVAKLSGRGLGFTGGTIDKLAAIPGLRTDLTDDEFVMLVKSHGLAVAAQTVDIAPADGKLYALRDVTATVDSIPLIASSIMSKKIAAGADQILLDVKVGSGAFMKTLPAALELAQTMVQIGAEVRRNTQAIISSMEQPLGTAVGNSIEIIEAIEVLQGKQNDSALYELCIALGAQLLIMAGKAGDVASARCQLIELIATGRALTKFGEFISAQGGDARVLMQPELLPQPAATTVITAPNSGFIQTIDAAEIGRCAAMLGAGREYKGQAIDLAAGLRLLCRVGDEIKCGQPLVALFSADKERFISVRQRLLSAIKIDVQPLAPTQLIYGIVDKFGFIKNK